MMESRGPSEIPPNDYFDTVDQGVRTVFEASPEKPRVKRSATYRIGDREKSVIGSLFPAVAHLDELYLRFASDTGSSARPTDDGLISDPTHLVELVEHIGPPDPAQVSEPVARYAFYTDGTMAVVSPPRVPPAEREDLYSSFEAFIAEDPVSAAVLQWSSGYRADGKGAFVNMDVRLSDPEYLKTRIEMHEKVKMEELLIPGVDSHILLRRHVPEHVEAFVVESYDAGLREMYWDVSRGGMGFSFCDKLPDGTVQHTYHMPREQQQLHLLNAINNLLA